MILFFILFYLNSIFPLWAQGYDANQLLIESDRARGAIEISQGITWKAKIHSEDNGNKSDIDYLIKVGGDNALAEALAPPRNKGQMTLFNKRNVWFYKPGLKKPMSISPRQKLSGQAANGDIASTHYARDYQAQVSGEEMLNGIKTIRLTLKARSPDVTYDQITYWIRLDQKLAVQAEFLTLSGQPFKKAEFEYQNHIQIGKKSLPFISKMKITDIKNSQNFTVFDYLTPKEEAHSSHMFNVNNIVR